MIRLAGIAVAYFAMMLPAFPSAMQSYGNSGSSEVLADLSRAGLPVQTAGETPPSCCWNALEVESGTEINSLPAWEDDNFDVVQCAYLGNNQGTPFNYDVSSPQPKSSITKTVLLVLLIGGFIRFLSSATFEKFLIDVYGPQDQY